MALAINTELLRLYWSLGEDICEKQKQYKWGAKVVDRLSLDMRSEFPQSEGFSRTNLYDIKRWFIFYSSQIEIVHQAGGLLQKVDNSNTPMPEILLCVPWRHQTVIVSKCATINAAMFYLNKVVEGNMSRTELEHVIKAQLYEHTSKAADELLRGEGDNPSIGILFCKDKDSSVVEWSLRGITTPLGVASYQLQEVYERTLLEIKQEASEEE